MTENTIEQTTEQPAPAGDGASIYGDDATGQLIATITQREWLLIQHKLDALKDQIVEDQTRLFIALVWIKRKRDHGGADWEPILDMTDDQIYAELGVTEAAAAAAMADEDPTAGEDSGPDPIGPSASGTATAPGSVLPPG